MGVVTKYYCDSCGEEIPVKEKEFFGVKRTVVKTGKLNCISFYKNFDLSKYGVYLCELCAEKASHKIDSFRFSCLMEVQK